MTVITVAGMIGAGKTTLTNLIADYMNFKPLYEDVDNSPILPLFYTASDEEKEENEKKSIIPRTNQKVLRSTTIKQKDVFTEEKRKRLLEKMGELRRFHQLKDREIQNTKVSWSLLYNLLFCDYFNMLKKKKHLFV